MEYAIETRNLSKAFRGMYAVNGLDLHVPEGAIYGFIGENGSGKSTTEKLICGLLVPERGSEIRLYGRPHTNAEVRSKMGVLIENPGCFPNSTVYQNLMMQALNLGLRNPHAEIERVLKLVRMTGAAGRKFKQCSLGMRQRIGVAQSLMGHPRLLILDEPINGLDADGMRIVRETLLRVNREEGTTVLISSHILGELSKVATHYGIIREGRLVREVRADQMREASRDYVEVRTVDDAAAWRVLRGAYAELEPGEDGGIRVYGEPDSARVAQVLFEAGILVAHVSMNKMGLEEYYLDTMESEVA